MAEVMTDKAAVEVPSPVSGRVVALHGQPGDMIRVGAELVVFETESAEDLAAPPPAAAAEREPEVPDRSGPVTAVAVSPKREPPAATATLQRSRAR